MSLSKAQLTVGLTGGERRKEGGQVRGMIFRVVCAVTQVILDK